ncbi:hypothetical protein E4T52_02500 [Aureobasidium sp. EXF-3400]|nr:hypothetical protein E4T52_02500 [Aureobasidium sp. EXF-3400]
MSRVSECEHDFRRLLWLWAYCYDNKVRQYLLPATTKPIELTISYLTGLETTRIHIMYYRDLDPLLGDKIVFVQDYVAGMSSQTALGDTHLKKQHFLGSVIFEQEDKDSVVGTWQVQGIHRRDLADSTVASWNAYNYVRHYYRCNGEGMWKLDGLEPSKPLFMNGVPQNVIEKFRAFLTQLLYWTMYRCYCRRGRSQRWAFYYSPIISQRRQTPSHRVSAPSTPSSFAKSINFCSLPFNTDSSVVSLAEP